MSFGGFWTNHSTQLGTSTNKYFLELARVMNEAKGRGGNAVQQALKDLLVRVKGDPVKGIPPHGDYLCTNLETIHRPAAPIINSTPCTLRGYNRCCRRMERPGTNNRGSPKITNTTART